MAELLEKINTEMKLAMRGKDSFRLSVLRLLVSAVRNKEISLRGEGKAELSDEQIREVAASEIKKRRDAIEIYEQGSRPDLADKEKKEITILESFLPPQLNNEEIEKIAREARASLGAGINFGRLMGEVMARVKGQADGQRVSAIVKKVLES